MNEDFKILDLKEQIALNEKEGGRNRPQKCFDNIKKNTGICNENLRTMSSTRKCNALKELVKLEYGTTQMLQPDNARRARSNSSSLCTAGVS